MQLIFKKISFLALTFLLLPVFCLANEAFPSFPMAFWGSAALNGDILPSGTIIRAYCDDNLIGEIIILEDGIYGYDEVTKNKLLVSNCDNNILFRYLLQETVEDMAGGIAVEYTEGFISESTVNKDLNFINTQSCSISNGQGIQTWDGTIWGDCALESCNNGYHSSGNSCIINPSSSSGGGSGGGYVPPPPTVTNIKGDINNDKKVNKYDFALMMSAWDKTGTNNSDLNNDNKVDKYDFALLMANWGI